MPLKVDLIARKASHLISPHLLTCPLMQWVNLRGDMEVSLDGARRLVVHESIELHRSSLKGLQKDCLGKTGPLAR